MISSKRLAVTIRVPDHDVGKCLRLPVTKYLAWAAWAHIIIRVGTSPYGFRRPDPKAFLANGVKRAGYDLFTPSKPGTADDLFVLGINAPANAQLNGAADSKHEYLRGRPEGL